MTHDTEERKGLNEEECRESFSRTPDETCSSETWCRSMAHCPIGPSHAPLSPPTPEPEPGDQGTVEAGTDRAVEYGKKFPLTVNSDSEPEQPGEREACEHSGTMTLLEGNWICAKCREFVEDFDPIAPTPDSPVESPDDLRNQGWTVAVHNDYRQDGRPMTFWLFTKDGRAIKGEGPTDAEALNQARAILNEGGE